MSNIKIKTGDLLKAEEEYIAHQCNCITRRSAHLSKQVFTAFPYADIYSERAEGQRDRLGTIVVRGNGDDERFVINMLAQYYPGRTKYPKSSKDGLEVREKAFQKCLKKILKLDMESIAFPWGIGCGAAGGSWPKYMHMIEDFADLTDAEVVVYKLPSKKPVLDLFE